MEQPVVDSNCSRRFMKINNGTVRWVSTTFESQRAKKKCFVTNSRTLTVVL
jgi:hypothetical protein